MCIHVGVGQDSNIMLPLSIHQWWVPGGTKQAKLQWLTITVAKCAKVELPQEEMRLYKTEFQYQSVICDFIILIKQNPNYVEITYNKILIHGQI